MGRWLYRHVFRGVGILFWIGLITILYLAANFLSQRPHDRPVGSGPKTGVSRPTAQRLSAEGSRT